MIYITENQIRSLGCTPNCSWLIKKCFRHLTERYQRCFENWLNTDADGLLYLIELKRPVINRSPKDTVGGLIIFGQFYFNRERKKNFTQK